MQLLQEVYRVDVNLLPGGATDPGVVPEAATAALGANFRLLSPDVLAVPILFLASDESDGLTGERLTDTGFARRKAEIRG